MTVVSSVEFRHFQPGDETAFYELNEAWIAGNFVVEEEDLKALRDPVGYILKPGGALLMAERDGVVVGTCALLAIGDGVFEVAKMTVAEECRGLGIGKKLLARVIEHATAMGAKRLYLETNEKLVNAIHVYESLGFRHLTADEVHPSPYVRANVFMEMVL
jgi:putative acetyltransferase